MPKNSHHVVPAPDGGWNVKKAGADRASKHMGSIDLLLTDIVMPDTGGRALAGRLQELRPGLRVLFMSGYADDAVVRHGVLEAGTAFLQKPFTPGVLASKVRELLDGPAPTRRERAPTPP